MHRLGSFGVIGCPRGVERLANDHPDVEVILGDIDPILNDHAYIVPGLGDAGDRQFPTVPWIQSDLVNRLKLQFV